MEVELHRKDIAIRLEFSALMSSGIFALSSVLMFSAAVFS
jgi:hypothetical protein